MPDDTDGIQLYGGDVLGERGPDERVEGGRYLVVGSVRGDVAVGVTGPDGLSRPVTGTSTSVLPGYTVFYDSGAWGEGWDQVQLAPLVIVTDDGRAGQCPLGQLDRLTSPVGSRPRRSWQGHTASHERTPT